MTGTSTVAIIGAGPCGLAAAVAVKQAGLRGIVIERGPLVSGIVGYPTYVTFFSTPERLEIGGIPFIVASEKPTRRDALAYYRRVAKEHGLEIRQYERVDTVERENGGFVVYSTTRVGEQRVTRADAVVVATGYFGCPNRLGVPGEDLPHVTHRFTEGHESFMRRAIVVGGGNSAVDAALDLYRSGATVTIVHFLPTLDKNIKPWVLPDIAARIKEGSIQARWESRVVAIEPTAVIIQSPSGEERLAADQIYLMIGYMPESRLLQEIGVTLDPISGIPAHDPATMETNVPGIFIAGVLAAGYDANKTFIENGRGHGALIARALRAAADAS